MFIDLKTPITSENYEKRLTTERFSLFLLWLISRGGLHGYDIIKKIREDPAVVKCASSRIYPLLKSLSKKGLISQKRVMHGKRAKKVYRLTAKGRQAIARAKEYMRSSRLMVEFAEDMLR